MKSLRHFLLATGSSATLIGGAAAADLPTKAPPSTPVVTWTGFYAGVDVGGAWNRSSFTDVDQFFFMLNGPLNNNFWTNTHAGFMAGGLLGYNLQAGRFVLGVEGDINWTNSESSASIPNSNSVVASSKLHWISTFRGRLGATFDPSTLIYVTGGLAVARFSDFWGEPSAGSRFTMSSGYSRTGWTVGGGIERIFAPHWTGRVEALYSDFGSKSITDFDVAGTYRSRFEHAVTQARGALSYKW